MSTVSLASPSGPARAPTLLKFKDRSGFSQGDWAYVFSDEVVVEEARQLSPRLWKLFLQIAALSRDLSCGVLLHGMAADHAGHMQGEEDDRGLCVFSEGVYKTLLDSREAYGVINAEKIREMCSVISKVVPGGAVGGGEVSGLVGTYLRKSTAFETHISRFWPFLRDISLTVEQLFQVTSFSLKDMRFSRVRFPRQEKARARGYISLISSAMKRLEYQMNEGEVSLHVSLAQLAVCTVNFSSLVRRVAGVVYRDLNSTYRVGTERQELLKRLACEAKVAEEGCLNLITKLEKEGRLGEVWGGSSFVCVFSDVMLDNLKKVEEFCIQWKRWYEETKEFSGRGDLKCEASVFPWVDQILGQIAKSKKLADKMREAAWRSQQELDFSACLGSGVSHMHIGALNQVSGNMGALMTENAVGDEEEGSEEATLQTTIEEGFEEANAEECMKQLTETLFSDEHIQCDISKWFLQGETVETMFEGERERALDKLGRGFSHDEEESDNSEMESETAMTVGRWILDPLLQLFCHRFTKRGSDLTGGGTAKTSGKRAKRGEVPREMKSLLDSLDPKGNYDRVRAGMAHLVTKLKIFKERFPNFPEKGLQLIFQWEWTGKVGHEVTGFWGFLGWDEGEIPTGKEEWFGKAREHCERREVWKAQLEVVFIVWKIIDCHGGNVLDLVRRLGQMCSRCADSSGRVDVEPSSSSSGTSEIDMHPLICQLQKLEDPSDVGLTLGWLVEYLCERIQAGEKNDFLSKVCTMLKSLAEQSMTGTEETSEVRLSAVRLVLKGVIGHLRRNEETERGAGGIPLAEYKKLGGLVAKLVEETEMEEMVRLTDAEVDGWWGTIVRPTDEEVKKWLKESGGDLDSWFLLGRRLDSVFEGEIGEDGISFQIGEVFGCFSENERLEVGSRCVKYMLRALISQGLRSKEGMNHASNWVWSGKMGRAAIKNRAILQKKVALPGEQEATMLLEASEERRNEWMAGCKALFREEKGGPFFFRWRD